MKEIKGRTIRKVMGGGGGGGVGGEFSSCKNFLEKFDFQRNRSVITWLARFLFLKTGVSFAVTQSLGT